MRPQNFTSIDYYPVINHPITQYKTVQECLRYAEYAMKEVRQQAYVITTYDLGVWKYPVKYEKHIVMIGTFHVIRAYFKMIGKKMDGTGISDILLEAGLMSSGALSGVLSGTTYSRAINCHKIMMESLERLLLEQ